MVAQLFFQALFVPERHKILRAVPDVCLVIACNGRFDIANDPRHVLARVGTAFKIYGGHDCGKDLFDRSGRYGKRGHLDSAL